MHHGIFSCGAAGRDTHDELAARDVAATEAPSIPSSCSLRQAAQMLSEHGVSHLVVIDESNGHAAGVLSTTDILSAYAAAETTRAAQ
jgi:CBS domain-containing protein